MNNDKIRELQNKSTEELRIEKVRLLKEFFNLLIQKRADQLTKNHMFKNIRRNIARINTIISK